ncbi:hypothetical protein MBLNU13_g04121t2 [Cladosporium sp. NU13]
MSTVEDICEGTDIDGRLVFAFLDNSDSASSIEGRQLISRKLDIPTVFWHKLTLNASGFFWARTQAADAQYTTSFRFLVKRNKEAAPLESGARLSWQAYEWDKLWFIIRWDSATNWTVLCFDLSPETRDRLFGHVVESLNQSVWSWRDPVRAIEKKRASIDGRSDSYESMHELARHTLHSSEMLLTAIVVVERMLEEFGSSSSGTFDATVMEARREFNFHLTMLRGLLNRSRALEARLQNEINLAFHVNARHDSAVASTIADAAQRDGRVMKAISTLGMVFLPGTFVSAIFSMSFFHFAKDAGTQPEYWAVSREFWVYWAVAIPLTALTLDNNTYSYGCTGQRKVVIASLRSGSYGTVSAACVAHDIRREFRAIQEGLVVGIAGGMPRPEQKDGDIRLGDHDKKT